MNLDPDREFVLLGVRDASYYEYLKSKGDRIQPGIEIEADTYIRNPDIDTYVDAARLLGSHGVQVIRFGISSTPLSGEICNFVTDYSTKFRTPERDLVLARHCRAAISGSSGIWCFASMHNKPVLWSDTTPPLNSGVSIRDRMIPQLLRDSSTNRLLSFREVFRSGDAYSFEGACHRDGIALRKNSPEEITEAVLELLDLDEEIRQKSADDHQLLQRFQELRESAPSYSQLRQYRHGRIGLRFLRRHRALLD
jgi:putative glycosyltransferase (TIGR04372 family)